MKLVLLLAICGPITDLPYEELVHYLTHVKHFWATLVDHDRTRMALIDLHTVDTLQLYAPRASKVDRKTVKGKILGGEVFSNFSRSERAVIWKRLRSHEACDGIIPSLHTFFRDISYLELCANAVKRLVLLNKQQSTVRSAFVHSFRSRRPDGDCLIQTSETSFRRQPGTNDERLSSGYRQIWMYAMRHYPEMAKDVQSGQNANPTRAKARATADEGVIHDMAALARKLGFRTPQIKAILKQSPDRQIARAALLKARKPDHYYYDSETFESLIERIAGCFALAIPRDVPPAALVTGRAIKLKDRCGAPPQQTQQLDRPHIFFDQLHSATVRQGSLSSLEVRRCVYYAFFGKPSSQAIVRSTPSGQLSANEPLSPLFVPNGDSHLRPESVADDMSRSGSSEWSFNSRRRRSEARGEQRPGFHQQQAAMHRPLQPGECSPQDSTGGEPTDSEAMNLETWGNSDAEVQPGTGSVREWPAASGGMDLDSEERECTDIDEDELMDHVGNGNPRTEGVAAVEQGDEQRPNSDLSQSIREQTEQDAACLADEPEVPDRISRGASLTAESQNIISETATHPAIEQTGTFGEHPEHRTEGSAKGQDSQILAVTASSNTGAHGANRASQSPQTQGRKAALNKGKRWRNSKWAPYLSTQKRNGVGQDQQASEVEKQLAAEGVEQERLGKEAVEKPECELQHEAAAHGPHGHLARNEQSETDRRRRTEERGAPESLLADPREGITEKQVAHDMETTVEAADELLQKERVARERADALAQLQTPGAAEDHVVRPVTELSANLPNLIARWREEGSQLSDASVSPTITSLGQPEGGAAVSPPYVDFVAPSDEDRQESLSQRPRNSEATGHQGKGEAQGAPAGQKVKFHVYEQGAWRKIDTVSVRPGHLAEAQTIANQYAQDPNQKARFYDDQLRKVSVDSCVRNAIDNGSYTVLMSFRRDLPMTRRITASAALLLKTGGNGEQGYEPELGQGNPWEQLKASTDA